MSDFTGFLAELKDFINRPDLADSVVTRWVRFAESRMNQELRCKEMLHRATAYVTNNTIQLPDSCVDITYLRVSDGRALKIVTMDEYWELTSDVNHPEYRSHRFCRHGQTLLVNPQINAADGQGFEIGYYRKVDPFVDAATTIFQNYDRLYFNATLASSAAYLVEDDRIPTWEANATAMIQSINDSHTREKFSGSPLHLRRRSFG